MSKKFSNLNRREFLLKASYLLGSVGVTPFVRAEMLYDFSKKFMPEALASDIGGSQVHHFFDLTFRFGMPLINIGTGVEFANLGGATYYNSPATPGSMLMRGRGDRPIWLNGKTQDLAIYASNLAITQGVSVSDRGLHVSYFNKRGPGKNLVTPIIQHAARNSSKFVVGGVHWFKAPEQDVNGNVMNVLTGGFSDLQGIPSEDAFNSLFTKPNLRLSEAEVAAVSEATKGISGKQGRLLEQRMNDAKNAVANQAKAMDLMTQDYNKVLEVTPEERKAFRVGRTGTEFSLGEIPQDIGLAMIKSLKAMQNGLLGNAQITVQTGDWHGAKSFSDMNRQNVVGEHLAAILAATMEYLRKTPSLTAPGKKLSEVTLIQVQSEFTRPVNGPGTSDKDNNDGGTDGTLLLGDMINGGYYGGFDFGDPTRPKVYGFHPETGDPRKEMVTRNGVSEPYTNKSEEIYNTVQALLGNPTVVADAATWTSWIRKMG